MENKPLRFNKKRFFINGEFHELVNVNRAAGMIRAYNFSTGKLLHTLSRTIKSLGSKPIPLAMFLNLLVETLHPYGKL